MKHLTRLAGTLLTLSLTATSVCAATLNQTFMNDFAANTIYVWSDDTSAVQLGGVTFGSNMLDWSVQTASSAALVLSGSVVAAGLGRFTLGLSYSSTPFSLQWAEVFLDSGVSQVLGSGTLTYGSSAWTSLNAFSHGADIPHQFGQAPVPLPPSALLLLSALAFLPLRRLHSRC